MLPLKKRLKPFEYVPAAATNFAPYSYLAVKYEDNKNSPYLWQRTRFNGITTHKLPDRTLYYGVYPSKGYATGIMDSAPDSITLTSISNNPTILAEIGFNYMMGSPEHTSRLSETRRNEYVRIFTDSGGFQLISGASDWIDPDKLISLYNRTTDYGIGLDIPVPAGLQAKYCMRMCEVMLKNNDYLRSKANNKVEIYDVSHGRTLDLRQKFLQRVLHHKKKSKERTSGLAIGGIGQNWQDEGRSKTIVSGSINMIYAFLAARDYYERFHILGTTGTFYIFLYYLMLSESPGKQITADSTSYLMASANNLMLFPSDSKFSLNSSPIPKAERSNISNCSCSLCNQVKYSLAYHKNAHLTPVHNLHVIQNQVQRIEELSKEYLSGKVTLREALTLLLGDSLEMVRPAVVATNFVQAALKNGFKATWDKHQDKLTPFLRKETSDQQRTLFGTVEVKHPREDRLKMILSAYEKFHG